ncbi:MAG: hypothetical protein WB542_18160 [Polaromonas sp.]
MKASDWIDRVKKARGWDSDYRAAKELGITRSGMSLIRTGDTETLREETAIMVAQALGEKPEAVVLDQFAERVKNPAVSATLHKMASSLCILCKVSSAIELIASFAVPPKLAHHRAH